VGGAQAKPTLRSLAALLFRWAWSLLRGPAGSRSRFHLKLYQLLLHLFSLGIELCLQILDSPD